MQQPIVYGERVILRPWSEGNVRDVAVVLSVASDPLIPSISEVPKEPDVEGARAFIAAQNARHRGGRGWAWAITSREADAVIGYVGALWIAEPAGRASIGYWMRDSDRRSGLTAEAVTAAAGWLLTDGGSLAWRRSSSRGTPVRSASPNAPGS